DRYIDEWAALDPLAATRMGVPGYEDQMPDLSPEGMAQVDALIRRTLLELADAPIETDRDRIAKALMDDRLGVARERFDALEHERDITVLGSRMGSVRSTFGLMRLDTDDDWAVAARRMLAVPGALDGWVETQRAGMAHGIVAA